jgi:hypothetical protein
MNDQKKQYFGTTVDEGNSVLAVMPVQFKPAPGDDM